MFCLPFMRSPLAGAAVVSPSMLNLPPTAMRIAGAVLFYGIRLLPSSGWILPRGSAPMPGQAIEGSVEYQ